MIGLIKKMINSDHRESLNNLMYIQDLVTSGQNGYVANSEECIRSLTKSPNVMLNNTAKTEFLKALAKYPNVILGFIRSVTETSFSSYSEMASNYSTMQKIANSSIAMQIVVDLQPAIQAIVNSTTAMQAITSNSSAFQEVLNSSTALQAVLNSSIALSNILTDSNSSVKFIKYRDVLNRLKLSSYLREVNSNSRRATGRIVILYGVGNTYNKNYANYTIDGVVRTDNVDNIGDFIKKYPGKYATQIQCDNSDQDKLYYFNV